MNPTMRDYIKRRVWWCAAFAVGGWLMFPLGAAIEPSLPDGVARAAVWIVGFVKARLGQTIAMPVAFSWGSGPKVNFCPFCGVNLDEPLPRPQSPPQSLNPIQ